MVRSGYVPLHRDFVPAFYQTVFCSSGHPELRLGNTCDRCLSEPLDSGLLILLGPDTLGLHVSDHEHRFGIARLCGFLVVEVCFDGIGLRAVSVEVDSSDLRVCQLYTALRGLLEPEPALLLVLGVSVGAGVHASQPEHRGGVAHLRGSPVQLHRTGDVHIRTHAVDLHLRQSEESFGRAELGCACEQLHRPLRVGFVALDCLDAEFGGVFHVLPIGLDG